ncbi:MAG TPA: prepilin-type N-terminal cleavage/methylation domain-containing protein [Candidatus Baltobacteraceae bacterium]|nr:prepilin-type N-terminal cleavage/methylation domain-containing protein [Candidatus Baltobacteraceae bacterium]
MSQAKNREAKGFTLIELLIVIGIIGILAAIVLVAVDPAKRLKQSRNARRFAETNAILNAILNYTVDYKGKLPNAISGASANLPFVFGSTTTPILTTFCPSTLTGETENATNAKDLAADTALIDQYISEIPVDPRGVNDAGDTYSSVVTGYYFVRSSNGRVTVGACNPESEDGLTTPQIKVKR